MHYQGIHVQSINSNLHNKKYNSLLCDYSVMGMIKSAVKINIMQTPCMYL